MKKTFSIAGSFICLLGVSFLLLSPKKTEPSAPENLSKFEGVRREGGMVFFTVAQTLGDYSPVIPSQRKITTIQGGHRITTIQELPVQEGPNSYTVSMPEEKWLQMKKDL